MTSPGDGSRLLYRGQMYFSYSQFLTLDAVHGTKGVVGTEGHYRQGFVRGPNSVSFLTLEEFGNAQLSIKLGQWRPNSDFVRVIEVPFEVVSGRVCVEGPDEYKSGRAVAIEPGNYRLTCSQAVTGEDAETIELVFEPLAAAQTRSRVIVVDAGLDLPRELLETS